VQRLAGAIQHLEQGSEEWGLFRWGLLTGATAAQVYGNGRAKWKCLSSILQSKPGFVSEDTQFGLEYEKPVLLAWARKKNIAPERLLYPGICVSSDPSLAHLAYSPDALLVSMNPEDGAISYTLIEVKCKRKEKSCLSAFNCPPSGAAWHADYWRAEGSRDRFSWI
jgi:hypothetical protein